VRDARLWNGFSFLIHELHLPRVQSMIKTMYALALAMIDHSIGVPPVSSLIISWEPLNWAIIEHNPCDVLGCAHVLTTPQSCCPEVKY